MAAAFGGDPRSAFAAGFFGSIAGSGMSAANITGGGMALGSALIGGISSEIAGGDFKEGFLQAGIIAGFNNDLRPGDGAEVQSEPPAGESGGSSTGTDFLISLVPGSDFIDAYSSYKKWFLSCCNWLSCSWNS